MGVMSLAQSYDALQQVQDALDTSQVSGWDVLAAVGIVVVAYPVGRVVARVVTAAAGRVPNMPDDLIKDTGRLSRWFIYLVAMAWAMSLIGVDVGWVAIVVAVVVVFVLLMAKPMVENIAAGTLLTMRPAFGLGDQVDTAGYRGTVEDIGSRSTVLRTSEGLRINIPNTDVLSHPIVVYSAYDARKAEFAISVAHDTDLDKATRLLVEAISAVDKVQQDPAPEVQAKGFDGTAVTLSISYWYPSSMTSDGPVTDGVIRAVKKALAEAEIELAVPILDVEGDPPPGPSPGDHDEQPPDDSTGNG
jgi:small-conductance mechanosensitive channel